MGNPLQIVGVIGFYLMFSLKWGPKFMEKRKAFDLKNIMMAYNLIQVAMNSWLFGYVNIESSYLQQLYFN
jgi:hypothetical protein